MMFPNASAMDATASSGGPSTFLPQIVTGSPEQIAKHVTELLKKATEFTNLFTDFTKAAEQLEKTWSGEASESALKKISDSLSALTKIIQVVQKGAELLGISGTLVKTAQEAYRSVVGAVNPTVASLMSNPWTYSAAVALSTSTSATLRGFIEAIGGLLKALGVGDLASQISQLGTIIGEIEKLFGGGQQAGSGDTGGAGGTTPTNSTVGGTPVANPQAPAPVASPSGQQAAAQQPSFTGYTPPALAGGQGGGYPGGDTGGGYPTSPGTPTTLPATAYPSGGYPSGYPSADNGTWPTSPTGSPIDPSNSWIPVDQPAAPAHTLPAHVDAPVQADPLSPTTAGDHQVLIRTDLNTGVSVVEAPAGQDLDIDIDMDFNGKHFEQHLDIDAGDSVSADR